MDRPEQQKEAMHPPILLVEDDLSHATLVERVLRRARVANAIVPFTDGREAVAYLENGEGKPLPALVLLDVHVPGLTGLEILRWLRSQPRLRSVPVVMLSGSGESADINSAFELGVDTFLVKPVAFEALLDAINDLQLPWAILPREASDEGAEGAGAG